MDWIIFGDDWGVHPSTTQHLVLNLPPEDKVIWVNSIGMRSPSFNFSDISRAWLKLKAMRSGCSDDSASRLYQGSLKNLAIIQPKVIPWHLNRLAVSWNSRILRKVLIDECEKMGMKQPVILSATPVISQYASAIPHSKLAYLRLDVYERYPGCDPHLVLFTEENLYKAADKIFLTAKALFPPAHLHEKSHYLPQGVDLENFKGVSLTPSREKVLGFFGTVSEWLDFDLIKKLALAMPDWTFEFIGKIDYLPVDIKALDNVCFLPQVPFSELSGYMSRWSAAWIPFVINELTVAVNPLKIREYLASGLPSVSTPLPEVEVLSAQVKISSSVDDIKGWLNDILESDTVARRENRRGSVESDSWKARANELRHMLR